MCRHIGSGTINLPSSKLSLKILKVLKMPSHLCRANTEILILKKTKNYFYLVAMIFLLEKPSIHWTMSAESYTPQLVFLIFVHGLHIDSISILVTHHTTGRRVRHSSDYLVDNPSFLLEMFQGWSNSNHNEKKKIKSNKQYSIMATDYILFKKH